MCKGARLICGAEAFDVPAVFAAYRPSDAQTSWNVPVLAEQLHSGLMPQSTVLKRNDILRIKLMTSLRPFSAG